MKFSVVGERDPFLLVKLARGESVKSESNAMVSMDATLDLRSEMQGGVMAAIGRKLANGESFFTQHIEAVRGEGETLLAPLLPGDIQVLEVGDNVQYFLNDGAYLAAEPTVDIQVQTQSIGKALLGGTGGFFVMRTAGRGQLAVAGFGSIFGLEVTQGNDLIIDNQHVIAWDSRLSYSLSMRTGKSKGLLGDLVNSVTSGEGIVTRFSGSGKVYLSSRNAANFVQHIVSKVPSR